MSEIRPALTKEEWKASQVMRADDNLVIWPNQSGRFVLDLQHSGAPSFPSPEARHAIAALALHGQAYGFTHDDVAMLRTFASPPGLPSYRPLMHLAARIEALLPPEDVK